MFDRLWLVEMELRTIGADAGAFAFEFVRSIANGDDGVNRTSEFERLFKSGGINEFDRLRMMPVRSTANGSFSRFFS